MIAFITGSGFYDFPGLEKRTFATRFGEASLLQGEIEGNPVLVLPRHGEGHRFLPHQINHRANMFALKVAGATAVVSCSVCGIINPEWEIGGSRWRTTCGFRRIGWATDRPARCLKHRASRAGATSSPPLFFRDNCVMRSRHRIVAKMARYFRVATPMQAGPGLTQ